jgi:hypothetical protein
MDRVKKGSDCFGLEGPTLHFCYRKGALGASCCCFAHGVRSKWRHEHVIKGRGEHVYGKRIYSVNVASVKLHVRVYNVNLKCCKSA